MKEGYIAGIDIGNASTEAALGRLSDGRYIEVTSGISATTGLKGTLGNLKGILRALDEACAGMGIERTQVDRIRINEATPVIGDFAMETITSTIVTESTMVGHNPDTPGGLGLGIGNLCNIEELMEQGGPVIAVIGESWDYEDAAAAINQALEKGVRVCGAIAKKDDGVLIANRLSETLPVLDEVEQIEKLPLGALAAIEVAGKGRTIDRLSDPYGIATVFSLGAEETKQVVPIAKAIIGARSAVVIKTPIDDITERVIAAGKVTIKGEKRSRTVDLEEGADKIMEALEKASPVVDVEGESGTNVGGMMKSIKEYMTSITGNDDVKIRDLYAVDTILARPVSGGIANEFFMEKSVGIAVMVKTDRLQMERLAAAIEGETGCETVIGGVEAEMATIGALTTPGVARPMALVDMGAGSIDASVYGDEIRTVHLAGAGDMTTSLIQAELGLDSFSEAERIKKYPLARSESLYQLRYEDGSTEFLETPLDSKLFARVLTMEPDGLKPLDTKNNMEKIRSVRRSVKKRVLIENCQRALKQVSLDGSLRSFDSVVLVGGTALDFELSGMLTEILSAYGITAGKGNIRGTEGPRNAVATGLIYSTLKEGELHE